MESIKAQLNIAAFLLLVCAASVPVHSQDFAQPAGGKWTEYSAEDRMTGAKKIRFELLADNSPDSDDSAKIILFCNDGKLELADFRPNMRMAGPNRPGFWGQPQLEVEVRIDDVHNYRGWNWQGRFLTMDKGTARGILQADVFNIALPTRSGRQIAEFQPDGLDVDAVRKACDLTPKKPSKD